MIYRKRYDDYVRKLMKKIKSHYHGLAFSFSIHPAKDGSGVIVINIGIYGPKPLFEKESPSLKDAFKNVDQKIFKGDLSHIEFIGTNVIFDASKAIIIKDANKNEWSTSAVDIDFNRIFRIRDVV
ncbi:TPA: hypothetical protein MCN62_004450 [Klebsiella pneumoniae]|uniref:hypothetical protein n=1 Tax=Klebsiella pneumoniae TaxID=573 RepID=UPI001E630492|nr:hypothetical protein [Klebsiella pneumoniae]HDK6392826.1 hypothetical protein [Klebsiella variicola]MCD5840711.1 hypothetical protein [Klebsiella pneumoniae]WLY17845.1 hypothetical protein RA188_05800 [Klebsiella pneumoniae]HBT9723775.1 hypothetical protein [Klebsiella pneumoniae]HBY7812830.1 hypothetical protein [Klebsiella pneumoniae]